MIQNEIENQMGKVPTGYSKDWVQWIWGDIKVKGSACNQINKASIKGICESVSNLN